MNRIDMTLNFQNTSIKYLPVDPVQENYVREVKSCLSRVNPTSVDNPQLVHVSEDALKLIDLDLLKVNHHHLASIFSGNQLLPGSQPVAYCYCGHQFGKIFWSTGRW